MTNKTEDRFYFGKHGQPERFAKMQIVDSWQAGDWKVTSEIYENDGVWAGRISAVNSEGSIEHLDHTSDYKNIENAKKALKPKTDWMRSSDMWKPRSKARASRPGQPDEFDLEEACWDGYEPVGTKRKDGRTVPNCVPMKNEKPERFAKIDGSVTSVALANPYLSNIPLILKDGRRVTATQKDGRWSIAEMPEVPARRARNIYTFVELLNREGFARPGQPEKFDASSLDRKGFAAASSSPMLGKLLSEKQMPEGGWRAVETGGNALVISFEDGDVAGNFARRVASNGYSATAPVQSIGRYWNVEVKNG